MGHPFPASIYLGRGTSRSLVPFTAMDLDRPFICVFTMRFYEMGRESMMLADQMEKFGRRCFGLMWIPFVTFIIGMVGMPDGEYSWFELPAFAKFSLIGAGAFCAAAIILIVGAKNTSV